MPNLKQIAHDKECLQELQKFLLDHLDQLALIKVYRKESTYGISDAKVVIEDAIAQLEALYQKDKPKENINLAR